jgi:hypothetical protein
MEFVNVYSTGGGIRKVPVGQGAVEVASNVPLPVTATRTLVQDDTGGVLTCNSGSAIVVTIPADTIGQWLGNVAIAIYQAGAGASSFAAGAGVTLRGTPPTPAQYATHAIMRVGVNEWVYL